MLDTVTRQERLRLNEVRGCRVVRCLWRVTSTSGLSRGEVIRTTVYYIFLLGLFFSGEDGVK